MKKVLAAGAALLTTWGAGVIAAPVAQAGVNPPVILVSALLGCKPTVTNVVGNPGDSFSIATGIGCAFYWVNSSAPISPGTGQVPSNGNQTVTLGASGSGTFDYLVRRFGTPVDTGTITVTVTTDPIAGPTVHDDLQQVGVPASGDCADVSEDVGHYPGAPIGGWSKSWALWINDGKGGPVCTRELEELSDGRIILVG